MEKEKFIVVDSQPGEGKSSWAIDNVSFYNRGHRFIFVTPYLDEVDRVIKTCKERDVQVYTPSTALGRGSKSEHLKQLLLQGKNIVTTHALFDKIDSASIDLIGLHGYTMYMDEVHEVIDKVSIAQSDYDMLEEVGLLSIDETDGRVTWVDKPEQEYDGIFCSFKNLCELGAMYKYNNTLYVWCFPIRVFEAMKKVYVLTYMFEGQIQSSYYEMNGIKYIKKQVVKKGNLYELVDFTEERERELVKEIVKKINLYEGNLNYTSREISLSSSFMKSVNKEILTVVKNNALNYFQHIIKGKSDENMWTTLKDYKNKLKGKGYTKGFVPLNARATNKYSHKKNLAYLYNRYLNPIDKNFFVKQGIIVDEDKYALSELLQWLFRSSIRKDGNINLYLPAKRMRELYLKWSRGEM